MKSKIEDLNFTVDKAITIQFLNSYNSFFAQFLDILSDDIREKE